MGSYANFYVDKHEFYSSKNELDEYLISKIFRKEDFRVFDRSFENRIDNSDYLGDKTQEVAYIFQNTSANIIDRLEIQGFTELSAKKAFEIAIRNLIKREKYDRAFYKKGLKISKDFVESLVDKKSSSIDFFSTYSYSDFQKDIFEILIKKISPFWNESPKKICSFIDYFQSNQTELLYTIEGYHPLHTIRSLLANLEQNKLVTYDITDIIVGGYVHLDEIDFEDVEKIIILTEGSTDTFIIKESLNLLYPHLQNYYHFLDFHSTNNPGGIGNLVTIVKSFIGSGIKNNIIALFDNDSAGREAIMLLNNIKMPKNIKVLTYPDIPTAKSYPTIGPTGKRKMNINGLACSIELYLGEQIIRSSGMPQIQWKSLNAKTKTYQGEIQNKALMFERFREQINSCKIDLSMVNNCDWTDLKILMNLVFNCFK